MLLLLWAAAAMERALSQQDHSILVRLLPHEEKVLVRLHDAGVWTIRELRQTL